MRMLWLLLIVPLFAGCTDPIDDEARLTQVLLGPGERLILEVDYAVEPDRTALAAFETRLSELTGKDVTVHLRGFTIESEVTRADLPRLHEMLRDHVPSQPDPDQAGLHIVYLPGELEGSPYTMATTLRSLGLVVMFPDTYDDVKIRDETSVRPAATLVEQHVLLHELGHAFGLVGQGLPSQTPRGDPDHPGHSTHRGSVMYGKLPVSPDRVLLVEPQGFDAADLFDILHYRITHGDLVGRGVQDVEALMPGANG